MSTVMVIRVELAHDEQMKVSFYARGKAKKDKVIEDDATFAAAVAGVCLLAREAGLKQTLLGVRDECKEILGNSI
jgi:hypothetical protein